MRNSIASFYIMAMSLTSSCAQNRDNQVNTPEKVPFTAELMIDKLDIPWGMAFLPDGSMLITEKSGKLIHYKDGNRTTVSNVPEVYNQGQGGLLDIELHPQYAENGWIYITYSSPEGEGNGANTALIRAKLDNGALTGRELLYKGVPNTTRGQHYGSRILFDGQGYLYFSIGDRGDHSNNPQDITKDGGKIYRLHDDGRVPEDNPFVSTSGAKTAIYSYGHRNPQGMAVHPNTGAVWDNEHGPRGGDEINIIKKGANYGWPLVTYGINYNGTPITDKTEMAGMEQPIKYWVPSIAPSGMAFITSDKYPGYQGGLLVGSLSFQYLELLKMDGSRVTAREKWMDRIGRVRNVKQGPDGLIYVAVEGKGIYKLVPKA